MKHKVTELEGALLDAAVAKAEGQWSADAVRAIAEHPGKWRPSLDWAFGGPIIERERIGVAFDGKVWCARPRGHGEWSFSLTPLTAAMRAYVASKFGEEVELPDEHRPEQASRNP